MPIQAKGDSLPTLGAYEVELKDGYVVAAVFADGTRWTADGPEAPPTRIGTPVTRTALGRSYARILTHALVLGAVIAPMSFTVASAQTGPVREQRLTIPLVLDDSIQTSDTAGALRAAAAEASLTVDPPPAPAPVAAATPATPAAKAPVVKRATAAPVRASGGGNGRFPWGWCTWYVASKRSVPWSGNAIEWWPNAAAMGFAEGQTPKVGAIMVTRESGWGHVAYVDSVDGNGGFTISEMNYVGFGVISTRHFTSNPSFLVGFIY